MNTKGILQQRSNVRMAIAPSVSVGVGGLQERGRSSHVPTLQPGPGSEFFIARLMELILVEMLRRETPKVDDRSTGLIAGLLDPAIASALLAVHGEIAREWNVAELARLCGVSRSGFASRFKDVLGIGPIEYLMHWRMAVAKDELRRGTKSISEIALAVGFQSASAFSTSFTRAVGYSPSKTVCWESCLTQPPKFGEFAFPCVHHSSVFVTPPPQGTVLLILVTMGRLSGSNPVERTSWGGYRSAPNRRLARIDAIGRGPRRR